VSRRKRWIAAAAGGVASLLVGAAALAQSSGGQYDLSWRALHGGGTSTGGNYTEQGVIGQGMARSSTGGGYTVDSGFLGGGAIKFKRYVPLLSRDGSN